MFPNPPFMIFEDQCSEPYANVLHSSPDKRVEQWGQTDRALVGTFTLPIACSGGLLGMGHNGGCDSDLLVHSHQKQRGDHAIQWEMNGDPTEQQLS